ncbi:acyltransferase family-domain-containing protein [Dactylonectria estremocensis]|uniref:Acyltransferase family-domain-containing protein n=1 Tax=Dactylonectria estremocensis TaxID=1079267 RepID=A0A9P9F2J1_9HYPO|nr:acyltransferase family-domain-containing protein [Dactylonectria estremocensis]
MSFDHRPSSITVTSKPENRLLNITRFLHGRRCDESLQLAVKKVQSTFSPSIIGRIVAFLTPSFLQARHARDQDHPPQLGPTAYLNGIRGVACLVVFNCHYANYNYDIAIAWGSGGENYNFPRLPIVRLLYAGIPAVCVFFVISGYCLSYKALKLVRSRNGQDFSATMSSLIFRRGIRLYLPTTFSTFIIAWLLRMGMYEWFREHGQNKAYFTKYDPPVRLETTSMQLMHWANTVFSGFQLSNWRDPVNYDRHLWTIPLEYRSSLCLFLVLYGTARLRTFYRITTLSIIMYIMYRESRWPHLLFLSGMAIVEWDHHRGAHATNRKATRPIQHALEATLWNIVSFLGLYLLSLPFTFDRATPGYGYLTSLTPKWWSAPAPFHWHSIGSVIFVLASGHSRLWQRFFTSRIVQYFGNISYSLYIVHGAVTTIGCLWFNMLVRTVTGVEGYWGFFGFFLSYCFATPLNIWCADIFHRAIDIPSVKFAKGFEGKLMGKI